MKMIKRSDIKLTAEKPFQIIVNHAIPRSYFIYDTHYALQLCIFLDGAGEACYPESNGFLKKLCAGQAFCAACWEPHGSRFSQKGSLLVLSFSIEHIGQWPALDDFNWLAPFLVPPMQRPFVENTKTRKKVISKGQEIAALQKEKPFGYLTRQWLLIHELMIIIQEGWEAGNNTLDMNKLGRVMPAVSIVNTRDDQIISLEEAAAVCGLSRSRFSLLFTENIGVSFHKFQRRARMSKAKSLLQNTGMPIKEIALSCGFSSPNSFNNSFKNYFSRTPEQMRYHS